MPHDSFPNCGEDVGGDGEVGRRKLSLGHTDVVPIPPQRLTAIMHKKKKEMLEVVKAWRGSSAAGILQSYKSSIVYSYYRAFVYA